MTTNPVREWLGGIGLERYTGAFDEHEVSIDLISSLNNDLLKDLGVDKVGHRIRILRKLDDQLEAKQSAARETQVHPPPHANEAERRQLTVMFCDLAGSTALSTKLDAEDLRDILLHFQEQCRTAIARYGGFIARYMGDGLLVYFGYPKANENDAERAIKAGLGILNGATDADQNGHRRQAIRIGIASGLVVVGDLIGEGAAEEAAVVGETPNLAARLQNHAQLNELLVADATRSLAGDGFEYQDVGRIAVKGIAERVQVWSVLGETSPQVTSFAASASHGLPRELVGRQRELDLLRRAWSESQLGRGQVVLVSGEPGVGKSRLMESLKRSASTDDSMTLTIRCSPYHLNSALHPVIEHLKRALGWTEATTGPQRLQTLENGFDSIVLSDESIGLLARMLGIDSPQRRYDLAEMSPAQARQATLDTIVNVLLDSAEARPTLLIWEDLHWADSSTLEVLDLIVGQCATVSMLNVFTFRPDYTPPWRARAHITPLTLGRLSADEAVQIIDLHTRGKPLPSELLEHIVDKSDGVPLYLEQLTLSALDSPLLEERGEMFSSVGAHPDVQIPATLQGSLMARLDREPLMREVAQLGSVLGREFTFETVRVLSNLDESQLRTGLGKLVDAELLYQRGRPPKAKFMFKHALIAEAAYQSLLRRTRLRLHQAVTRMFDGNDWPEADAAVAAHHYMCAEQFSEAAAAWQAAAQETARRSAYVEAAGQFESALAALNQLPPGEARDHEELALQVSLGRMYTATHGYAAPKVESAYLRARELSESLGDSTQLFFVLRGLCSTYAISGQHYAARQIAERLVGLASQINEPSIRAKAHQSLGTVLCFQGDFQHAKKCFDLGIGDEAGSSHGTSDSTITCLTLGAVTSWFLGFPDTAKGLATKAVQLSADRAQANAEAMFFASWVSHHCGEVTHAQADARDCEALATKVVLPHWIASAKGLLGLAHVKLGETSEGARLTGQALEEFARIGTSGYRTYFLAWRVEALMAAGRLNAALDATQEAFEFARVSGEHSYLAELHRLKGELYLHAQHPDLEVRSCFIESIRIAQEQHAKSWELRAATSLARLHLRENERERAYELLSPVYAWFHEGHATADLSAARTLLKGIEP